MKIRYAGPADVIIVGAFGDHRKDEIRDYPDEVGRELIETAKKNLFEEVSDAPDPEKMTVEQLKGELAGFVDPASLKNLKKADLVTLWTETRSGLSALAG